MEYSVCKAVLPDDQAGIDKLMHDEFFPDMPLARMFVLENSLPPPRPQQPEQPAADHKNFIIKAVDSSGNIIGVSINKTNTSIPTDSETPPKLKKMVEFLEFIEKDAELDKLPERTIELRCLSIGKDWRQKGVGKRLTVESMKEARSSGFTTMRGCCTSEYAAQLVRSLGWREYYRLPYKDYPAVSGTEVDLEPIPPHDTIYYYVTDL